MSLIGAFLFFFVILFIGLFPFPLLYLFSNFIRFLIYRIFRYRKKVVVKNLEECFPKLTKQELNKLVVLYYKNLTDVFLEGIRAFTMSRRQILKRHKIINPEFLDQFYESGQSIIGVTGHYANWEWGSLSASLQTTFNVVAFYKQLNNRYIDKFVRWSRTRFGTTLASIKETSATFERFKNNPSIFLMAADQGMPKKFLDKAYWIQFLNHDTAFLYGMEKYARLNNLPIVYIDIQRVKQGYYTIELSIIAKNPLELEDGKLTEMYAHKLESIILKKPENWLWSHRRWKFKRQ
jgi:Kdo2-lipid IVA lauroyltransferase/acyltransferase